MPMQPSVMLSPREEQLPPSQLIPNHRVKLYTQEPLDRGEDPGLLRQP